MIPVDMALINVLLILLAGKKFFVTRTFVAEEIVNWCSDHSNDGFPAYISLRAEQEVPANPIKSDRSTD